jgi:hypothetical protein
MTTGREEVGDGSRLEGAVGGEKPEEDRGKLGEADEGREGVETCRRALSPVPRLTKYDNGGGGARG